MSNATFTLSLDCEGMWGMADNFHKFKNDINSTLLNSAYDFLINLLSKNQVHCTAAFVTAFGTNRDELLTFNNILNELHKLCPAWYSSIINEIYRNNTDGILQPELLRLFELDNHEIGWHGTTHIPANLSNSNIDLLELELFKNLTISKKYKIESIVFPRNIIPENLNIYKKFGFSNYRGCLHSNIFYNLNQFSTNPYKLDLQEMRFLYKESLYEINSGHFLNWPSNLRSLVPINITVEKWKQTINYAIEHSLNVHMWFHPHNLITAPQMQISFSNIINYVGEKIKSGELKSKKFGELVRSQLNQ